MNEWMNESWKIFKNRHAEPKLLTSRRKQDGQPVLVWCWPSVVDGEPTLNQRLFQRLVFAEIDIITLVEISYLAIYMTNIILSCIQ